MRTILLSAVAGCIVGLLLGGVLAKQGKGEGQEARDRAECRMVAPPYSVDRYETNHAKRLKGDPWYRDCLEAKGY